MTATRAGVEALKQCASVSVVIVNWNTRDLLRSCLASLPWASSALTLQVIVVDNGSDDGSVETVRAEFPAVEVVQCSENVGFVKANNQGLARAAGDYVFMLNSDTEVRPGCIERLAEVLGNDPEIGAVGPRLLNTDGTLQSSFGPFPRVHHRFLPSRFERAYCQAVEAAGSREPALVADVDWLAGAAVLTRRDVLQAVGPLDARYFMWYDDLDWCQKLKAQGYRRVFVADAVVIHHGRQSGRQLEDRRLTEQLFDSEYLYLRLHAGLFAAWVVFGLRVGKAALTWLVASNGGARTEAAWRLGYHRQRFVRFCLSPVPRLPA